MKMRFLRGVVLLVITVAGAYIATTSGRHISVENTAALPLAVPKVSQEVTMVFAGDIMLSRKIGELIATNEDGTFPFASTTELISSADIAFANLENPVSTGGIRSGSIYSFRADPSVLERVQKAGFKVVSIANNHIWDYGRQAFLDTLAHLSESGIAAVGGGMNYDEAHEPKMFTVGETNIAFLAYTNLLPASLGLASSTPAVARYDDDVLQKDIKHAKGLAGLIVTSFHWGEEYQTKHNAEQERIAKLAIDSGANLVIGHHPHVAQEVEEYNGGWIAYSLGNFVFDQNFSDDTKHGLALLVTVVDDKITDVTQKQVAFTDDYRPYFEN
ncbi:MAG: Capsule synthesis protein, CapA [Parcubacteria group bacterium GW2011_GWA2_49_9]|nr:MAG: Capsule synthesis protein, CapA [Parcubacteria group bacterium GW2011_GWA2_49_9]